MVSNKHSKSNDDNNDNDNNNSNNDNDIDNDSDNNNNNNNNDDSISVKHKFHMCVELKFPEAIRSLETGHGAIHTNQENVLLKVKF